MSPAQKLQHAVIQDVSTRCDAVLHVNASRRPGNAGGPWQGRTSWRDVATVPEQKELVSAEATPARWLEIRRAMFLRAGPDAPPVFSANKAECKELEAFNSIGFNFMRMSTQSTACQDLAVPPALPGAPAPAAMLRVIAEDAQPMPPPPPGWPVPPAPVTIAQYVADNNGAIKPVERAQRTTFAATTLTGILVHFGCPAFAFIAEAPYLSHVPSAARLQQLGAAPGTSYDAVASGSTFPGYNTSRVRLNRCLIVYRDDLYMPVGPTYQYHHRVGKIPICCVGQRFMNLATGVTVDVAAEYVGAASGPSLAQHQQAIAHVQHDFMTQTLPAGWSDDLHYLHAYASHEDMNGTTTDRALDPQAAWRGEEWVQPGAGYRVQPGNLAYYSCDGPTVASKVYSREPGTTWAYRPAGGPAPYPGGGVINQPGMRRLDVAVPAPQRNRDGQQEQYCRVEWVAGLDHPVHWTAHVKQ
jgi:hypothetical protein